MDDRITLDRMSFKALAAESRILILKSLYKRQKMQSELALELGMKEPSVSEHLHALAKAGLIEKHDEGRKWKYYTLTTKGKAVLDPEQKRIWITLALLVFSVAGGFTAYLRTQLAPYYAPDMALKAAPMAESGAEALMATAPADTAHLASQLSWGMIGYGVWIVLLLSMLLYSWWQRKKYQDF
jgi:DNA-binding transcriptional ArsR family regulator